MAGGIARADDGNVKDFLGTWSTVHSRPFPPGSFREFLTFSDGGVVHETNNFLHTASNLDFSMFGLPNVVNGSDGAGSWTRVGNGVIDVVFHKMLFDGARVNFGDLHVTGRLRSNGTVLTAEWHIDVVNAAGARIDDFGPATSQGTRIQ
jgi:hypothetical protein